jgi:hypothetical protein
LNSVIIRLHICEVWYTENRRLRTIETWQSGWLPLETEFK